MPFQLVDGLSLYYEEAGAGRPVVFLPGVGGDSRAFGIPLRRLARSYRAIAIDHRDAGRSDRATRDYTTADMAADAAGLLDALGLVRVHVVGHSLGGLIAQELALGRPELVGSLTLVSSHLGADAWRQAALESWVMLRHRAELGDFTRGVLPWLASPKFFQSPAMVEGLVRFAAKNEWPQDANAYERQARAAIAHDTRERLGSIRAPALVVVGSDDLLNPPRVAQELADRIAGARLEVIPGVGHLPHVEDSAAFLGAITRFLDSLE